jgi:hypothetical protein
LVGRFVATSGEKRWPPVGKFVAAVGENSMAIDNPIREIAPRVLMYDIRKSCGLLLIAARSLNQALVLGHV